VTWEVRCRSNLGKNRTQLGVARTGVEASMESPIKPLGSSRCCDKWFTAGVNLQKGQPAELKGVARGEQLEC